MIFFTLLLKSIHTLCETNQDLYPPTFTGIYTILSEQLHCTVKCMAIPTLTFENANDGWKQSVKYLLILT